MTVAITPQTKVGELLAAYPQLEAVLLAQAPEFAKLRNPLLRRTVGRVATLQAAARTANLKVTDLVDVLRAAVGQAPLDASSGEEREGSPSANACPDWAATGRVTVTLDVDALLERGDHPLAQVTAMLSSLGERESIRLTSSFRPEPLVEALAARGRRVHTAPGPDGRWTTLVANPQR